MEEVYYKSKYNSPFETYPATSWPNASISYSKSMVIKKSIQLLPPHLTWWPICETWAFLGQTLVDKNTGSDLQIKLYKEAFNQTDTV